ncbi:RNA 2',3'-cyclic phosphodiesterase [Streptomyces sp. NPDC005438]|uniref:RNA 2',3'-cyclic phosphodiesterase n=1 Tax=Streptomyces sp. NPDC005438 TaxID=3156880 RepID=UPI0033B77E0F
MRLFVALLPPASVTAELGREVERLRPLVEAERLRWTDPAGWHITLAFLGELEPARLPGLGRRLERAARRHPPLRLRLRGGGRFGDRALWTGVDGDRRPLSLLAASVAAGSHRAGAEVTRGGAFRAHLTLARAQGKGAELGPAVAALAHFTGAEWTAGEVSLVRSHLPAGGVPGARPRYEPLDSWALTG